MSKTLWTRDEFILVMNLYTKIRYGQFNNRNSDVIKLAKLINKTPGAVAYKLVHLSSQDPYHRNRGIKGLANPGRNAVAIYKEFQDNWDEMLYESITERYRNCLSWKRKFARERARKGREKKKNGSARIFS